MPFTIDVGVPGGANIAFGHGYSMAAGGKLVRSAWRVPLYPVVLAGLIKSFGGYSPWVQILQALGNAAPI